MWLLLRLESLPLLPINMPIPSHLLNNNQRRNLPFRIWHLLTLRTDNQPLPTMSRRLNNMALNLQFCLPNRLLPRLCQPQRPQAIRNQFPLHTMPLRVLNMQDKAPLQLLRDINRRRQVLVSQDPVRQLKRRLSHMSLNLLRHPLLSNRST